MWQKQQVVNHMTCASFVKLVEWKFESEASEFAEWNYNQEEFKERLPHEGDITLVRKFEKRSSSSHGEEPNNRALAHCRCNNAAENFDRHVTQTLCQNYSRQYLFQDSFALKALAFWAVCVSSLLARFRVRDRNYLSVRFIFRVSEAALTVFRGW